MPKRSLPQFSQIQIGHIESQLDTLLADNRKAINSLLEQKKTFTWDNLMQPLEELDDRLHHLWSPVSHLNAVKNSVQLRQAYNACLPKLSEYGTEIGHNKALYEAIVSITKNSEYHQLDIAQKKLIEHELRDFKLAGVALTEDKKKQYAQLSKQLSQLMSKFEENVLDANQSWTKHITDEKELSGIPAHAIHAAKEAATQEKLDGWLLTLDIPSYFAVLTYADSQQLRKEMHYAYNTRASETGPDAGKWDNSTIMDNILTLRKQLTKLLNFDHFAQYSLATKMVKKPEDVLSFLNQLADASLDKAKQEFSELERFAKEKLSLPELNAWDIGYAAEKLRQDRYAISQEDLRPYFPEKRVVAGLFDIVKKLFQVDIKEEKNVDTWHPDVHVYAIYDQSKTLRAKFYMDLYSRKNKRGGAWMDDYQGRRKLNNSHVQIPVAYITCNLNPPVGDQPALFKHDEVVTLFHEFGHGLQHMLTTIDYSGVSGINGIPWDAVEVASQFLENWAWEKQSITMISQHYETDEPLPDELFDKMQRAKYFQSALMMMRQLEFALFDFRLHMEFDPTKKNQIADILSQVRSQVSVLPTPDYARFQHSFAHIFAGGYAAGYYSYKWAEVMAADAFSLFLEKGIFDHDTSQKFLHTILESGGAKDPLDLFMEFRGREPQVDSLLKQSGII